MGRRRAPRCDHPPPPLLPSSVDVGALDQERDPYVGAPLIEVLAAQSGGDDVDRADVPKRALRLFQRLLCGVIRRLLGASDQLNDLYDGHEPSSFSARWGLRQVFYCTCERSASPAQAPGAIPQPLPRPRRELTPSLRAACCQRLTSAGRGAGAVSQRKRSSAPAIAAASSGEAAL